MSAYLYQLGLVWAAARLKRLINNADKKNFFHRRLLIWLYYLMWLIILQELLWGTRLAWLSKVHICRILLKLSVGLAKIMRSATSSKAYFRVMMTAFIPSCASFINYKHPDSLRIKLMLVYQRGGVWMHSKTTSDGDPAVLSTRIKHGGIGIFRPTLQIPDILRFFSLFINS